MSAAPTLSLFGEAPTIRDYADLERRWINPTLADEAGIRRIDDSTGKALMGATRGNFAGLLIPYYRPGAESVREYRLRRDQPEFESVAGGKLKESRKYVSPPGRGNMLYFAPGVPVALLQDAGLPVFITEGEFKTLALWRLSNHQSETPRFLPVGVAGVWNWRGTIGKANGPDGDRRDVKGVIPDFDLFDWRGRKVTIVFDADCETKSAVRAARYQLAAELIRRGAAVGYLDWPITEGKGIDDRLANTGPDTVLEDIGRVDHGDWQTKLIRDDKGRLRSCLDNAALYLENHMDWDGVLAYNEFDAGVVLTQRPPAPITAKAGTEPTDSFDTETARWFERKGLFLKPELINRLVDAAARRRSFHPVRAYLNSLVWDGVPRLADWLVTYAGAEPSNYVSAVGSRWMIGAVARVMRPGCKHDCMLILEGEQGSGKSRLCRALASDEWFTDQLESVGSKDASMQLRGRWIVEFGELDAFKRADWSAIKLFLSQQDERFRVPYGRRVEQFPRQCVFIGSTNKYTYLGDETGSRRFWPVRTNTIDVEAARRDRDQLWAEAVRYFHDGAEWHLEGAIVEDAKAEAAARYDADVWQDAIERYLETHDHVTVEQILVNCLDRALGTVTKGDQMRVGKCLGALKWDRKQCRIDGKREWRYCKP